MTILCYHAVQPGWTSPMTMHPGAFAEQCAWLARRKTVVSLQDALSSLDGAGRLPRGTAALTFDDGFASVFDHALPELMARRLPATVFLVAQTLTPAGQRVDWVDDPPDDELVTLSIEQIREMQAAGISFESHSWSHADLTRLSFEDCVRDLRESRELLESLLEHPVRLLAYPRGRHNEVVRAAARQAGYSHAFTLPESSEPAGPYSVPRVGVYQGNSVSDLRVKSARPYLPLRTGRAYQVIRRARRTTTGAA